VKKVVGVKEISMTEPSNYNTILSIADAVNKVRALEGSKFATDDWMLHRFPFWLWFRGQPEAGLKLEPYVFREIKDVESDGMLEHLSQTQDGIWDETNLFNHLKLRVPNHRQTCHSAFDWLCLMQHYSLPTRLLDWSESILPALYFAVRDDVDKPGELFVLNARRLNKQTKPRPTMCVANDPLVTIRAVMADVRTLKRLKSHDSVINAARMLDIKFTKKNWWEEFLKPIAVIPNRLNDRMVFQTSVFTLHGSKKYPEELKAVYGNDSIPDPVSLEAMNNSGDEKGCIFKRYVISPDSKKKILKDLILLGIHEGTLFPEVDHQAAYIRTLWRFTISKTGSTI